MANPFTMFKTDPVMENETGVVLDYGDFGFRIKRAGGANKSFGKLLDKRLEPYRRQMEAKIMDEDVATNLMIKTYIDTIIIAPLIADPLGDYADKDGKKWRKGLYEEDGSILEGTKEEMIAYFTKLPEQFRDVQSQANSIALFRAAELEADVKN